MLDYLSPRFEGFRELVPPKGRNELNYLLIVPQLASNNDEQYVLPLGLAYISAALKATGRNIIVLNLNYKNEPACDILSRYIREHEINVCLSGGLSSMYADLHSIQTAIHDISPEMVQICGGGIISGDPVPAMTALDAVDYGVIGEGEITICELCTALEGDKDISGIKGIAYRENNEIKQTPARPQIVDISVIPWADYEGLEFSEILDKNPIEHFDHNFRNKRLMHLTFSRSCPYQCTFCFHTVGNKFRARTLDDFFEEFDYLLESFKFDAFMLEDEFFLSNMEMVKSFSARIKKYGIIFSASARVDNITEEMLRCLYDSGCRFILFGIESASDAILKSMRKNITVKQIENALALCRKMNINIQGNLIFGDISETYETALESIEWNRKFPYFKLNMHWITAYPGTYDYKYALQNGIIKDPIRYLKDGCPWMNISKMTMEEVSEISLLMDTFEFPYDALADSSFSIRGNTVNVSGVCPYCGEKITLDALDLIRSVKTNFCIACGHLLNVYAIQCMDRFVFESNLRRILENDKIVFWPVAQGFHRLLDFSGMMYDERVFIVDSNSNKHGRLIRNKKILPPDVIISEEIRCAVICAGSVIGNAVKTTIKAKYPGVTQVFDLLDLFKE